MAASPVPAEEWLGGTQAAYQAYRPPATVQPDAVEFGNAAGLLRDCLLADGRGHCCGGVSHVVVPLMSGLGQLPCSA